MTPIFRLYGHRGASVGPTGERLPENTLVAFRAALAAGADALETDVRLTADGAVVVCHDATGARTFDRPVPLREVTWGEVRRWRSADGAPPLRLSELLEAFPGVFVNVDLKDDLPEAAEQAVLEVERAGAAARVGLGSFHTRVVRAVRCGGWRGQLALSVPEVAAARLLPGLVGRHLVQGDAVQIPVRQGALRLDGRRFLRRCHRLGLRVDYWTVDDPDHAVDLIARGADGIVTNDPGAIRAAIVARWGGETGYPPSR